MTQMPWTGTVDIVCHPNSYTLCNNPYNINI